jgi:MFS family permease
MTRRGVSPVEIFLAFACAYFFSALLRAVTAALAPVFSAELSLGAADLGLLAGAYFFGFAAMQLPLGRSLDRHGPRRTLLALTMLAVLGCAAFASAPGLPALVAARALTDAGMTAGLMAPLTAYRRHFSPAQAAQGLLGINVAMLLAFATWGAVMPRMVRLGLDVQTLMRWGLPMALLLLVCNVVLGPAAGAWHWAFWCVACTFIAPSQPDLGAAFPAAQAGRALSAYNLVIFGGVFSVQRGLGLLIDGLRARGLGGVDAFRLTFAMFGTCSALAYAWFLRRPGGEAVDNPP